jgi:hypothetical protein
MPLKLHYSSSACLAPALVWTAIGYTQPHAMGCTAARYGLHVMGCTLLHAMGCMLWTVGLPHVRKIDCETVKIDCLCVLTLEVSNIKKSNHSKKKYNQQREAPESAGPKAVASFALPEGRACLQCFSHTSTHIREF